MKKLFCIIVLLLSVQLFAQKVLISDNRRLDSLTSSFKTYSVTLVVNDSVIDSREKSNMILELQRNYSFLKGKKVKQREADFTILINIKGITVGSLEYKVSSKSDELASYTYHQYSLDHVVSASLLVSNKETDLTTVNIGSDVIVKRKYNYTEKSGNSKLLSPTPGYISTPWQDQRSAMQGREGLRQIWEFQRDFYELFNKYKTSKL